MLNGLIERVELADNKVRTLVLCSIIPYFPKSAPPDRPFPPFPR